jgi:hypothetical protein
MKINANIFTLAGAVLLVACLAAVTAHAEDLPFYLKDRGRGVPTSMFGTYVEKDQAILYPFYEYYYDNNFEYKPIELGSGNRPDVLFSTALTEDPRKSGRD